VVTVTVLAVLGVSTPAIAAGRLVVSPRSEATEDGTAHLRVRAGERATLTAHLNGGDISKDSDATRRGTRTLDASLNHGLRHGHNVLRVTVQRADGATRRKTVRFTVPASVALVGAGRDERAVAGRPMELSGHQVRGAGGRRFPMRWKVVGRPDGRTASAAGRTPENMGDVIVSDYAKLKEVGTYGGCNTDATGCPPGLAYSAADRKRASADVYRGIELQAWVKLLPLGYPTFDLVPPYGLYEMYALSKDSGLSGTPPDTDVLNRLFGPVSPSGDPRIGGLGMTLAAYVRMTSPQPWSSTRCTWGPL
jgi:hypothetical protein